MGLKDDLQAIGLDGLVLENLLVLEELIASRSIFAQQVGLKETAEKLKGIFENAGAEVVLDDSFTAPFLLATFKSNREDAKTIIFYQHYDTVPADADQEWTSPPFQLTLRDERLYARGVDDDKGHIIARLTAIESYLKEKGSLPVNVIFMMEGAEESASTDLQAYLEKHRSSLAGSDLLIWEQGIRNAQGELELSGGNKGIVTFDARIRSADVDIHSSFGSVIESSTWYLMEALTSLRDRGGRILVDGLYERIVSPTDKEKELVQSYARHQIEGLQKVYGLRLPLLAKDHEPFLNRLFFEPSFNIQGFDSGYQGQGVKTILPCQASVKAEVRLVPGLEPHDVLDLMQKQLVKNGFDQVELIYTLGEKSYRSDLSAPSVQNVIALAQKAEAKGVSLLPTSLGTGPMHTVFSSLEVPMVAFGLGSPTSRDHGGDENVLISDYLEHIKRIEELVTSYE